MKLTNQQKRTVRRRVEEFAGKFFVLKGGNCYFRSESGFCGLLSRGAMDPDSVFVECPPNNPSEAYYPNDEGFESETYPLDCPLLGEKPVTITFEFPSKPDLDKRKA